MADKFFIRVFQPLASVSTDAVLQFARTKNGVATRTLLADLDDAGLFRATSFGIYGGSNGIDFTGAPGSITVSKGIITAASAGSAAPFIDSDALVKGSSDASKLLRFEVDGFTASTTRVLTPLNKDYTIEETGHQSKHNSGGSDALQLDNLAAPDDNTDLDASTTKHGLLRKLDNNNAHFLDGTGNWTNPAASATWTLAVNESGASLTNWTSLTGTWTVSSSVFHVNTGATTLANLKFTAATAQSGMVYEVDLRMSSTGGFAADNRIGLLFNANTTAAANDGIVVNLRCTGALNPSSTGQIYTNVPYGLTVGPTFAFNFSLDTYYNIRVVNVSDVCDVYIDGVYKMTFVARNTNTTPTANALSFIMLNAYNCIADFKNIKLYKLTLP